MEGKYRHFEKNKMKAMKICCQQTYTNVNMKGSSLTEREMPPSGSWINRKK